MVVCRDNASGGSKEVNYSQCNRRGEDAAESNLLTCLNAGMIENLSPQTRQRKVTKLPEFRMLEKQIITLSALYELQIQMMKMTVHHLREEV